MSLHRYVLGIVLLAAATGGCGYTALTLCRLLVPNWSGASARLFAAVLGIGSLILIAQALGTVGLLRAPFLVMASVLLGGLASVARRSFERQTPARAPSCSAPSGGIQGPAPTPKIEGAILTLIALAAGALVTGHWMTSVSDALHGGMQGPDTLAYHGPIAATFAQLGSVVRPPHVYGDPAISFYPASSELLHAVGIVLFSRDLLSPLLNLGWLWLCLLAAWCIGRPLGLAAVSTLLVAVVIDLPVLSTSQPGSGDNDVMALALMLSALALLFEATPGLAEPSVRRSSVAAVTLGGLAAGLAVGTKLAFVAPIGLVSLVVLVGIRNRRARLGWFVAVLIGCGLWFVRNLFAFGNPVPAVHLGVGGFTLPTASLPPSVTVGDLLGDSGTWKFILHPGLRWAFGSFWGAVLLVPALGAIAALLRGPSRLERSLAAAVPLCAVAYALTPRTADFGGAFFRFNLRYLVPAVLIGAVLLLRALPTAIRATRAAIVAVLGAGLIFDMTAGPHFGPTSALAALLLTILSCGSMAASRSAAGGGSAHRLMIAGRSRLPGGFHDVGALAGGLVGVCAVLLLLWPVQRTYLQTRYASNRPFGCELQSCQQLLFAHALHDARIAVAGTLGPYPLYGEDLSNTVVDVEQRGSHGSDQPIASCAAWRRDLAAGGYSYLVITAPYYLFPGDSSKRLVSWTRADPSARLLFATPTPFAGEMTVFHLIGRPHPGACVNTG